MTINKYTVVLPNGAVRTFTMPVFMGDCHAIASRLPHALVFLHLRKGFSLYAQTPLSREESLVKGPAVIFADANGTKIQVPRAPLSDDDATIVYRDYISGRVAA